MINFELLEELIADKYINVQKHPNADLYIYNYSASAQYERNWNEVTMACRGLILDKNKQVIARPFPKFFNLEEVNNDNLPMESYQVFEKMDGSLGILYFHDNIPYIATRGSFISEQAQRATSMLHTQYRHTWNHLDPSMTYLFEIIYPENRIVVDYGRDEKLVLLAIIENKNGLEKQLYDLGFPVVEQFETKNFKELKLLQKNNYEGFVIKYENGYRVKIKLEEYIRLHKIVTQISNLSIWEFLSQNMPFEEIIECVPDEFYNWVQTTKENLEQEYRIIEDICKKEFKILDTRKDCAEYYLKCSYPSVLFSMLDGKSYSSDIWKRIRPQYEKPYSISGTN